MNWQSLGKKIAAAGFPSIGASLGGPVGAAVGEQIAKALGAEPTPDSIAKTILHDDTSLIALRTIEADLEKERLQSEAKLASLDVADRKNARREHAGHWMTWALPLIIAGLWAGWRVLIVFADVSAVSADTLADTSSTLNNLFIMSVSFWLGSSLSSQRKDSTIDRAVK